MIKLLVIGLWTSLVIFGTVFGQKFLTPPPTLHTEQEALHIESIKGQPVSVPIIDGGKIFGYVVAQFIFSVDTTVKKKISSPLDPLFSDLTFQVIYEDKSSHFASPQKYDLKALIHRLIKRVNEATEPDFLKDVFVEQFTYVAYSDIRNKMKESPPEEPPTPPSQAPAQH